MKFIYMIAYIVFWLGIWAQLFLLLSFFFSLVCSEYYDRPLKFMLWLGWLFWYVYFLPLHKYGFSRWQNWVYFVRHKEFTSSDFMQWFCEPTPWLLFMLFWTFVCFFYEWSLRNRYDRFLVFMFMIIAWVLLTV